ncbi:condensation domain-containing protein [Streptomyces sp. DG1A-41]|uniref:condensation domain-containing protein n=1 Tax=Streptomyces sp. DG1A-41 TaxID=3125779 RepID=UPI0030CEC421
MGIAAESRALGLTGYQRDIWAAEARAPGNCQFNVLVHEQLAGAVDRELLGACLARAVREHDAFRLRFGEDGEGVPRVRRIAEEPDAGAPPFEHIDLSGGPDPARAVRIWCEQELGRPLDLGGGPLFRAAVVTEGPEAVHLVLTSHHIVTDAWALNALTLRTLSDYRSRVSGKDVPAVGEKAAKSAVRTDSASYWDSIQEFDSVFGDADRENDRAFYRDYLAGMEPALFTRSGAARPGRGRHSFPVGEELVRRILDAGASPFPYLLSAFAVCLGRIHQADEVVFGVPFLNRRTEGERSIVGQFANNLPVRIPVAEDLPLVELAERVRRQIDRLREHERLPFGDILREAPVQGADGRRLFDVTASYLRFPRPSGIPGVNRTTTIMAPVHAADALSVMVQAFDDEPGLRVDLDYADDVFDGHLTAAAPAGHVGELLRRGLDSRELPLAELPMLTDDEYEVVVRRRQGASAPYPREKSRPRARRAAAQRPRVNACRGLDVSSADGDSRLDTARGPPWDLRDSARISYARTRGRDPFPAPPDRPRRWPVRPSACLMPSPTRSQDRREARSRALPHGRVRRARLPPRRAR